jgi:Tol biopolymer transport system component
VNRFQLISSLRIGAALCGTVLFVATGLRADVSADATTPLPTPTSPTKATPTASVLKTEETLFFTTLSHGKSVLGRSTADGACKAFLGDVSQGWLPYLDPKPSGDDLAAAGAPDGSSFVLLTTRGGAANLWLISADGTKREQLTFDDSGIIDPDDVPRESLAYSPDGKWIAYICRSRAWVINLADRRARTLGLENGVRGLTWTSDSQALIVVQGGNLRRIALNGGEEKVLVADACEQDDILWDSKSSSAYYFAHGASKVDGTGKRTLVFPTPIRNNSLGLSSKGLLALGTTANGDREIFLTSTNAKNAASTQLTQGGAEAVWASPYSDTVFFLRDRVLWRCDLDGNKAKPLGASPMSHISLGLLPPLAGGCQ